MNSLARQVGALYGQLALRVAAVMPDRRGVAAVEFALILPILIAFYLGLTELQPGISIKRKLALVTRTLADLTTRSPEIKKSELKDIFGASATIMRPHDDTNQTQMVVTSVGITKVGPAYIGTVEWSCGWNLKSGGGAEDLKVRGVLSTYPVPTGFQNEGAKSLVLVETQYPYTPIIGYTITGTVRLKDLVTWPIREGDRVKSPTGGTPSGMSCQTGLL